MIETALALLCAFSGSNSADCTLAQSTPIIQEQPPQLSGIQVYGWSDGKTIHINQNITQPAIGAMVLEAEVTHVIDAKNRIGGYDRKACVTTETNAADREWQFMRWFEKTFGPPQERDPYTLGMMTMSHFPDPMPAQYMANLAIAHCPTS